MKYKLTASETTLMRVSHYRPCAFRCILFKVKGLNRTVVSMFPCELYRCPLCILACYLPQSQIQCTPGISIYKNKGLSGCPKEITGNAFHGFLLSVENSVAAGFVGWRVKLSNKRYGFSLSELKISELPISISESIYNVNAVNLTFCALDKTSMQYLYWNPWCWKWFLWMKTMFAFARTKFALVHLQSISIILGCDVSQPSHICVTLSNLLQ